MIWRKNIKITVFSVAAWPGRRCRLTFRIWKMCASTAACMSRAWRIFHQKRFFWGFKPEVPSRSLCLVCFQAVFTWSCLVRWQFGCGNWHLDRMSKRNDVSYDSSLILLRSPKANNFVRFVLNLTEFKSEKKTLQKVSQAILLCWFIWLRDIR